MLVVSQDPALALQYDIGEHVVVGHRQRHRLLFVVHVRLERVQLLELLNSEMTIDLMLDYFENLAIIFIIIGVVIDVFELGGDERQYFFLNVTIIAVAVACGRVGATVSNFRQENAY